MRLEVFTLYDETAQVFYKPFYQVNRNVAIRMVVDAAKNTDSDMHNHPEQFILYHLGSYVDHTGEFNLSEPKELVGRVNELMTGIVEADENKIGGTG